MQLTLALMVTLFVSTAPATRDAPAATRAPKSEPRAKADPAPRLRIAAYVTLAFGCGLLVTTGAAAGYHAQTLDRLDARAKHLAPGQRIDPSQRLVIQQDLASARSDRNVAIGTGVSAAVSLAVATTLLLLARHRDRPRSRLAIAPTWLPAGAGLTLQLRLR